jgi:hypothetical protein
VAGAAARSGSGAIAAGARRGAFSNRRGATRRGATRRECDDAVRKRRARGGRRVSSRHAVDQQQARRQLALGAARGRRLPPTTGCLHTL